MRARPRRGRGPRIVVVDDDAEVGRVAAAVLWGAWPGARISTCRNAFEAVRRIFAKRPDLIVTDLCMPGIPGMDLCRMVRETPDLAHAKILAMTGYHTQDRNWEALDSGADEYLTKPFTPQELREAARRLVGGGEAGAWPAEWGRAGS